MRPKYLHPLPVGMAFVAFFWPILAGNPGSFSGLLFFTALVYGVGLILAGVFGKKML